MTTEPVATGQAADQSVIALEANRPLLLDGAGQAWLIESGSAEVFAIELQDGEQAGPRRHIFSAQPGCLLLGRELQRRGAETALLAAGLAGTTARPISQATLQQAAAEATRADVVAGVDAWIDGLSAGLLGVAHVHTDEQLVSGSELALADGATAGPKDGVLWVTLPEGRTRFLNHVDAPGAGDTPFPLAEEAWLQASGACRIAGRSTAELAEAADLWAGLEAFQRAFLACLAAEEQEEATAESQRLQDELRYEQVVQADALASLAAAMEPRRRQQGPEPGISPLLAACRIVGASLGIEIKEPPSGTLALARDPLEAIAKASRIRLRRVLLAGEWWKEELGPLLAYTAEGQRPVALLSARGGYALVDPAGGTTGVAGPQGPALAPFALQFYRSLPPRVLTARDLLQFGLRGGKRDLLRILLLGTAGGLIATFIPIVTGLIFGQIIPANEPSRLVLIALALVASVLAATLFQVTRSIAMLRIQARIDSSVQPAIWDRLLALPAPFYRQYTAGDLAYRALGIDAISEVLTGIVTSSVLASIFSIFSFLLLFFYSLRLALVALVLALVTLAAIGLTGAIQLRYQRRQADLQGRISGAVLQFLTGIAKLRVAGAEGRAFAVWARHFGRQRSLAVSAAMAGNALATFMAFWPVLASMALFGAIAGSAAGAAFSTATYLAFAAAFGQFLAAMFALGNAATMTLQVVPLYERLRPILHALPEVDEARADPGRLNGAVEVNGASFRYTPDGPPALEEVSLQAQPGEFIALVGPSGSGKSSLFRLLLGFERPETGSIFYDGHDLADLDTEAVRRQIGTVIQNGRLQTGSIFDNIVGAAPLTMDDAWEAARMAGLDEDIRAMPMGMQTVISEGAASFSGGQRQRLLIARAVVGRPKILLFDEATSALDNRTQSTVTEALKNLQATRIVIAHRLSTVQNADRIYVVVAGRMVQSGTYEELMAVEGPFAQLARRQIV